MDYHLEITKRGNCVYFFNFNSFLGVKGILSYHFFFSVLNFLRNMC